MLSKSAARVNRKFTEPPWAYRRDDIPDAFRLGGVDRGLASSSRADAHTAPNFQNNVTIALRSRSTKLLESMSCSGLGLGGGLWPFIPRSNAWTALRPTINALTGSGAKLMFTRVSQSASGCKLFANARRWLVTPCQRQD